MNASVTEEITLSQAPVALAPAALILGACALLLSSRLRAAQRAIAVGAPLLAAVLLLASAGRALTGGVVLSHASRLFRVGSLDATLGFAVDQMSALVALVALVLVATSSFDLARRQDRPREIAALLVAGAGALFALLAEGFPTLLFGLGIAYLSSTLASSGQGRAPCRAAGVAAPSFGAAIVFASAAIALTFWSLGGRWLDDTRYLSDYQARFVAPPPKEGPKRSPLATPLARGTLTVVSHPGARVYLGIADESQLARTEVFGETPFVKKSLPAGLHKIAIAPGGGAIIASDGLEVALLDAVSIRADEETVIRVVGPSLSFHEIQPQLGGLGDRRLGPLRVGTVSTVLVALALAALSFSFLGMLRRGAGAGAAAACALFAAAALASKLAMFAPITPGVAAVGAVVIGLAAVIAAARDGLAMSVAAAIGVAGLHPNGNAALFAALALAPGLATMSADADASAPAAAAEKSVAARDAAPKKRGKKGLRGPADQASAPGEVVEPSAKPWPVRSDVAALTGMPFPLCGPYVALASLIVSSLFTGLAGVAAGLGAMLAWIGLAHGAGRHLASHGSVVMLPGARILSVVGMVAAPVAALILAPWQRSTERGWWVVLAVGLVPWGLAFATFTRARSAAIEPAVPDTEPAPAAPSGRIATAIRVLDVLSSLPTAWVDGVFASRAAAAADEPKKKEAAS